MLIPHARTAFHLLGSLALLLPVGVATAAEQRDAPAAPVPLAPLEFQGKPFFPIGSFDAIYAPGSSEAAAVREVTDRYFLDDAWLAAGGNIVIVGHLRADFPNVVQALHATPATPPSNENVFKMLDAVKDDPKFENVAIVVELGSDLIFEADVPYDETTQTPGRWKPVSPEKRSQYAECVRRIVARASKCPNVIGYYYDEPENQLWDAYDRSDRKKEIAFGLHVAEGLAWVYDAIKQQQPSAYVMPCMAWWNVYEETAPIYDVNLANEYPRKHDELYNVTYDASLGVDAVRKTGRASAVYMPPMWNVNEGWITPDHTLAEERYMCFAPITQGEIGIFGFRLSRCTEQYRQTVIYPVMRELARCAPWFLGEWHDAKLASDHDQATVDYLTQFPPKIRLLTSDEKIEEAQKVPGVPDCSHMLRRRADDGSYLLVAVNNRRDPQRIEFQLQGIPNLPGDITAFLESRTLPLAPDGRFCDDFPPFGVHVYTFRPVR